MSTLGGYLPPVLSMNGQTATTEEALQVFEMLLPSVRLSKIQTIVLRECWIGSSYPEIAAKYDYDADYVKDVGYRLWQTLSKNLGETVTKHSLRFILMRRLQKVQQIQTCPSSDSGAEVFGGTQGQTDSSLLLRQKPICDWGGAGEMPILEGREHELSLLKNWIFEDRCRLIGIFGFGGVGKSAIAIAFAEQVKEEFDYLIWRSLRNAPVFEDFIDELLYCFPGQKDSLKTLDSKISMLVKCMLRYRCLLILDDWDSVLQSYTFTGAFRIGYEHYGQLLRQIGESRHQSCLIITGREQPVSMIFNEGQAFPIRSLRLEGLDHAAGRKFLANLSATNSDEELDKLIQCYSGNPLILKIVNTTINDLFEGSINDFLEHGIIIYGLVRNLLDQHFERLSDSEKKVMRYLAVHNNRVSLPKLQEHMTLFKFQDQFLETIESLHRRSLIQKEGSSFSQLNVLREYILLHPNNEDG